jgi:hypothetical protein
LLHVAAMRRVALVLVLLVGCVPPPVYRVQRTARVPHPAAPMRTGEPLDGPVELSVGGSSVGAVRSPELVDKQASVEVASEQLRAELRIRLGERGELAPIYEHGMASSMVRLDPTQAPVVEGAPEGFGLAARYSFETAAPGFAIGLGIEGMVWQIPYVEYRTCVEYCAENNAPLMQKNYGSESVSTLGLSLTPTYRSGALALFAGGYTRRHPTIVRKGSELYAQDSDRDVDGGNYNFILTAGAEYRLPFASLMATVQQDLTRDPVAYGPTFGLAIAWRVPDKKPLPRWPTWREPAPAAPPAPTLGPPGATVADPDAELPDDPW